MARKLTQEEFISKVQAIHGDVYEVLGVYRNRKTLIKVRCKICGEVREVTPDLLLDKRAYSCPNCGPAKFRPQNQPMTISEFIKRANEKHNWFYDYHWVIYVNNCTKILIWCPYHNFFWQTPSNHLLGCGCPKCGKERQLQCHPRTKQQAIEHFRQTHPNSNLTFEKFVYVNNHTKGIATCPIHGDVETTFHNLERAKGNGCKFCGDIDSRTHPSRFKRRSKKEIKLQEYLACTFPDIIHAPFGSVLPFHELDLFIPSLKVAIEYNGDRWHNKPRSIASDKKKWDWCQRLGISLYTVWDSFYDHDRRGTDRLLLSVLLGKEKSHPSFLCHDYDSYRGYLFSIFDNIC